MPCFRSLNVVLLAAFVSVTAWSQVPSDIRLIETSAGITLTDAKGLALYTYDPDQQAGNGSACNEKCLALWSPLLAGADAVANEPWSFAIRSDGARQWRYKNQPLYRFVKDDTPHARYGDGKNRLWHVARDPLPTPPGVTVRRTLEGDVLTDHRGFTLYSRVAGASPCDGDCLDRWSPLRAPVIATGFGDWTTVQRREGFRQWAFKGSPLYSFTGDERPGDVMGDGEAWTPARVAPAPGLPAFVTIQNSDFGPILADSRGKTLYAFVANWDKVKRESCNDDCIAKNWSAVLAQPTDQPIDQWSIVPVDGGSRQWTFKGDLVYTYVGDARIGDTGGFRFAIGNSARSDSWLPLLQFYLIGTPE